MNVLFGLNKFQNRILYICAGLLLLVQVIIFAVVHNSFSSQVKRQLQNQLQVGSSTFLNLLTQKSQQMTALSEILLSDFAFKRAVHDNDDETIRSVLGNHKNRVEADVMWLVTLDGKVISSPTDSQINKDQWKLLEPLIDKEEETSSTGLFTLNNKLYQMIHIPIKAPVTIAHAIMGFHLDTSWALAIKDLTHLDILFVAQKQSKQPPKEKKTREEKTWVSTTSTFNASNTNLALRWLERKNLDLSEESSFDMLQATYLFSFVPLNKNTTSEIGVILGNSTQEAISRLERLKSQLLLVFFISMILSLGFAFQISRSISKPITQLTKGAKEIAQGHLDHQMIATSRDEIGQLTLAFMEMATQLKEKIHHITHMNDQLEQQNQEIQKVNLRINEKLFETSMLLNISQNSSRIQNFDELLKSILEQLIVSFDLDRASIMTIDKETDTLNVKVVLKRQNQEICEVPVDNHHGLRSQQGIAGKAIHSLQPVIVNDVKNSPDYHKYNHDLDHTMGSLACVPLVKDSKAVGVVNLVSCHEKISLRKGKENLLFTIASQIAIVLENSELHLTAITDGLTQLRNSLYFRRRLPEEIELVKRTRQPASLLLFDIDHFKKFNDNYGHQLGDLVLKQVASVAAETGRASDIAARYGGEEFVLILPETDRHGALSLAEKLRQNVENLEVPSEKGPLKVTISVGVAEACYHAHTAEDLIKAADIALYKAKEAGRNNCQVASSSHLVIKNAA